MRWKKLSRFEDDPIVYVENTRRPTQEKLSTTYKGLSKVSGHKLNAQQSAALLQTSNDYVYTENDNAVYSS